MHIHNKESTFVRVFYHLSSLFLHQMSSDRSWKEKEGRSGKECELGKALSGKLGNILNAREGTEGYECIEWENKNKHR